MTHATAEQVHAVGRRAQIAERTLRTLTREQKDTALLAIADALKPMPSESLPPTRRTFRPPTVR